MCLLVASVVYNKFAVTGLGSATNGIYFIVNTAAVERLDGLGGWLAGGGYSPFGCGYINSSSER